MTGPHRKRNDDALLLALACGASVDAAAKQCGLHERTIYRRLEDPEFQQRLDALRADMVQRSAGMLTAAAGEAVRTLLALLKETQPAAVRLGSARAILEVGMKIRQMVEIERQVAELEERIAGLQTTSPAWQR